MSGSAAIRGLPGSTVVVADSDSLAREAARLLLGALANSPYEEPAVCLSGGSTPKALYGLLATEFSREVPWDRVHWFWGDERMVPPGSPDSNERLATEPMLARIPVPPANIHPVRTAGLSADEAGAACQAASAYSDELSRFRAGHRPAGAALFDVTLLGMGPDGHTASLFPGRPAIAETVRWAVGVTEAGQTPFVPRVTLTRPALASSRLVLFLLAGAEKNAMLLRIAGGEDLPAGLVARETSAVWLIDRAAAGERTG